jgi:lysophospholipase L1-like esterase
MRAQPRGWRLFWFRSGAVLIGLLPFVLLETGLRFFDIGKPTTQAGPLYGFNRQQPLFERAGEVYRTARARAPFFNVQEFAARKPAKGFRAFCFGGSTVYGHPYVADTAFPKWLELELAGSAPSRRVEVINCGGVSYASYRLAPIVREVLQYQPDLVVLAMGDNEFLEDRTYHSIKAHSRFRRWIEERFWSLRTVTCAFQLIGRIRGETLVPPAQRGGSQLAPEVRPRLDDARSGYASYHRDAAWHRQVAEQFEDAARAMIAACRSAKIAVLLVALGSNLRDCPPFKSEHKTAITPEEETRWQRAFDAATAAQPQDLNAALSLYHQAEGIDGEHALLAYRIASCCDRLGQTNRAREYYLRAKEQDVCPLRMIEPIYQLQFNITAETKTPLVDARALLESLSPDGIPGNNIYLDHVHPTIGGHQTIAQAIAAKVHALRLLPSEKPWPAEARQAVYHRHFRELEANYFTNGRRRVEWLEHWARRQRIYEEAQPKDARGFLHQGFRYLDFGANAEAWESFRSAMEKDSSVRREIELHASELRAQGRPEVAEQLLKQLENKTK